MPDNRINVGDILSKHLTHAGEEIPHETNNQIKAAIKEIVEISIDNCAKEVHLSSYSGRNCGTGALRYSNGESFIVEIDKNSIEQVKQLIDYE